MIRVYRYFYIPEKALRQTFSIRTLSRVYVTERAVGAYRWPGRPVAAEMWLWTNSRGRCAWCGLREIWHSRWTGSYPNLCARCAKRLNEAAAPIGGSARLNDDIPF